MSQLGNLYMFEIFYETVYNNTVLGLETLKHLLYTAV